jgi:Cu+-exporting ATPase
MEAEAKPKKAATVSSVALAVEGVSCASCASGIRLALSKHDGVIEVAEGADIHHLSVRYDSSKTNPQKIIDVIAKAGFKSRVAE